MGTKPRVLISAVKSAGAKVKGARGGGHKIATYQGKRAHIPVHGHGFEIDDWLLEKILTDLGLTRKDVGLE